MSNNQPVLSLRYTGQNFARARLRAAARTSSQFGCELKTKGLKPQACSAKWAKAAGQPRSSDQAGGRTAFGRAIPFTSLPQANGLIADEGTRQRLRVRPRVTGRSKRTRRSQPLYRN